MTEGFGTGGWGTSPWGFGVGEGGGISVVSALAVSTHSVRVTLSAEPRHVGVTRPGDAQNPATWVVQRLDTMQSFTILQIVEVDAVTWDVSVLEAFGPFGVTHEISTTTLVSASGDLVTPPRSAEFQGLADAIAQTPADAAKAQMQVPRDLQNVPFPKNPVGGTLTIRSGGDYASSEGMDLVKKLILRRLLTRRGGFFHLPDYGIGLREKERLPIAELAGLKAQIAAQVKKEPEIQAADVGIEIARNVVTIRVRAETRAGPVVLQVPLGAAVRF